MLARNTRAVVGNLTNDFRLRGLKQNFNRALIARGLSGILQQVFQNHGRSVPDGQMVEEEIALGLMAEEAGLRLQRFFRRRRRASDRTGETIT